MGAWKAKAFACPSLVYTTRPKLADFVVRPQDALVRLWFALDLSAMPWYTGAMDNRMLVNKWKDTRGNAKRRGFEFTLTKDEFVRLLEAPCVYGRTGEAAMGLDRMDSDKGYTLANTSSCCTRHNTIKGRTFTHAEMLRIVAEFDSARACHHGHEEMPNRRGKAGVSRARSLIAQGRANERIVKVSKPA